MKRYFRISSFILQCLYSVFCVLDIIICLVYYHSFDTVLGDNCAQLALRLTGILFFVPVMPVGIILNILAIPPRQPEGKDRKRWITWTILSPVLYLLFYFLVICVFVATTGGV